jgi:hypothetical protein
VGDYLQRFEQQSKHRKFVLVVRDQEDGVSNPLAPTIPLVSATYSTRKSEERLVQGQEVIAGGEILRKYGRNNNSPPTGVECLVVGQALDCEKNEQIAHRRIVAGKGNPEESWAK